MRYETRRHHQYDSEASCQVEVVTVRPASIYTGSPMSMPHPSAREYADQLATEACDEMTEEAAQRLLQGEHYV